MKGRRGLPEPGLRGRSVDEAVSRADTGRADVARARSRSSAVAKGARERSNPTTPATSGVETEVAQPTPEPPPSVVIGAQSGAANFTQSP